MLNKQNLSEKIANINLFKEYVEKNAFLFAFASKKTFYYMVIIIVEIMAIAVASIYIGKIKSDTEITLHTIQKNVEYISLPNGIRKMSKIVKSVKKMDKRRKTMISLLKSIVSLLPRDAWLEEFTISKDGIGLMRGSSFKPSSIAVYMSSISKLRSVKSIMFGSDGLRKNKNGTYSFTFMLKTKWYKPSKKKRNEGSI